MSGALFSLLINGIVIVLLGATIVYAARLSKHLKTFRDSRKDFDRLVRDLSAQITKADDAVAALKQTARDNGRNLQEKIDAARALSDELQLMVESGDNIASRIEKQADRGRGDKQAKIPSLPAKPKKIPEKPESAFAIRDTEFENGEADMPDDLGSDDSTQSRAERELYDAMRKHGRSGAGKPQ